MKDKNLLTAEQREEQNRWDDLVAQLIGPRLGSRAEHLRCATNLAMAALRAAGRADLAEQLAPNV